MVEIKWECDDDDHITNEKKGTKNNNIHFEAYLWENKHSLRDNIMLFTTRQHVSVQSRSDSPNNNGNISTNNNNHRYTDLYCFHLKWNNMLILAENYGTKTYFYIRAPHNTSIYLIKNNVFTEMKTPYYLFGFFLSLRCHIIRVVIKIPFSMCDYICRSYFSLIIESELGWISYQLVIGFSYQFVIWFFLHKR